MPVSRRVMRTGNNQLYRDAMFNFEGLSRLQELTPENQRVLVRADLDCPMSPDGRITDVSKLTAASATLRYLLEHKARVVVVAHQNAHSSDGVPASLEACGAHLAELLKCEVLLPDEHDGPMARKLVAEQREGTLVLLENLARDPREARGDEALSHALARDVDLFVGDCLDAPASYASLSSLPRLCKDRTLGIAVERELLAANQLNATPPNDLLVVLGGPFDGQASLRKWALRRGATIAVTGPMAATLLAASGVSVGRTNVDNARLAEARTWLELARREGTKVVLPKDFVVVGEHVSDDVLMRDAGELGKNERIVDIGPESVIAIGELARQAKSTLLVGEMGLGRRYVAGSRDVLRLVAATGTFSVALHGRLDTHLLENPESDVPLALSFTSTSGGALVDILCGRRIAAVETLRAAG